MEYKEWSQEVIFAGQRKERGYDNYAMPTRLIFWADSRISEADSRIKELEEVLRELSYAVTGLGGVEMEYPLAKPLSVANIKARNLLSKAGMEEG